MTGVFRRTRTGGGGKPPPYAVGTDRPVRWFSACTGGGTRRSRPTNHMGSPFVFVGRHLCVPPCGGGVDDRHVPANPYRVIRKFDGAACGTTPQGGLSWPVGPIRLLPTSSRRQRVSFTGVLGRTRTSGGGKPPPYAVGTNQPVMWFLVHTGGTCFDGAVCGPTPQGGFSWPVGPIHLLWASAPTKRIRNPVLAGLRGLWPSHHNNAKHGLSALPHPFCGSVPNHKNHPKL